MSSVIISGDSSGAVTLAAPATAGTVTVTLPATSGTMAVVSSSTGVLAESAGGTGTTVGYNGFKNRIINGGMQIDQRNAGSSVTPTAGTYTIDRWYADMSAASKYSIVRSATAPAGFINSILYTSTSAYSVGAGDYFYSFQAIEGLNVSDLNWGTASASPVTLSFWVRSSLTGTFGGSIKNSSGGRSYPFTYTISAANTFEYKTITITGDTSGTWLTTNGVGLYLCFGLGVGTTFSGTSGAWAAANYLSATGATSVVGTSGATLYITGVQLEKGSTATSFDYRPYGTELALCQRYYQIISRAEWIGASAFATNRVLSGISGINILRAAPTVTIASTGITWFPQNAAHTSTAITAVGYASSYVSLDVTATATSGAAGVISISSPGISLSSEL